MLLAAGCKKDSDNEPQTLASDKQCPAWTVPADYDYTSSMTAVVKVDIARQYSFASDFEVKDDDVLAAFIGETCVGKVSPDEGFFILYIAGTEGTVTLRYYSAFYRNIFVARDAFPYKNDENLGTIAEPFVPAFVVAK